MDYKRTIFSTTIANNKFRFAESTMREIETLVAEEVAAYEAKDYTKVKDIHYKFVLQSMNNVHPDPPITMEDVKDIGGATFNALYSAMLATQGIKLEAKTTPEGESVASQTS